jgi:hypothetical protein
MAAFPIGQRVATEWAAHLLKGETVRIGTVVGYSPSKPDSVYVRWDGWEEKSRVLVPAVRLFTTLW